MMNLIIRNAKVIDIHSPHHNKTADILIKNGRIEQIAKNIQVPLNIKECKSKNNTHLSRLD